MTKSPITTIGKEYQREPKPPTARDQIRWQMFLARGGEFAALCDLCEVNKATDVHECFPRSTSVKNEAAREISYHKELCVCLCRRCHAHAQNRETAEELLRRNIKRYGYEAVKTQYDKLDAAMKTYMYIQFPEEVL